MNHTIHNPPANPPPDTASEYRPAVGIILLNSAQLVWVGRRFGITAEAWQMPQGGIDRGETAEAAEKQGRGRPCGAAAATIEPVECSWRWP